MSLRSSEFMTSGVWGFGGLRVRGWWVGGEEGRGGLEAGLRWSRGGLGEEGGGGRQVGRGKWGGVEWSGEGGGGVRAVGKVVIVVKVVRVAKVV
jgi:hypothetical protein